MINLILFSYTVAELTGRSHLRRRREVIMKGGGRRNPLVHEWGRDAHRPESASFGGKTVRSLDSGFPMSSLPQL